MPKEYRAPSHSYRHVPAPLPSEQPAVDTTRKTSIWTPEDDETLMGARAQGYNWKPIADLHFPQKSANACRKRHERLMERRSVSDWDGSKLEMLATQYMAVRKEMWSLLANRLDEKWQTIESKCMEKGIKNLQAAFKSAQRKERGMMGRDFDSGIGGSSDTDAEFELDMPSTHAEASRMGYGTLPTSTSTAYSTGPATMGYVAHSTGYDPGPMQAMPSEMLMRERGMGPVGMSINAMLSPSPPAM